MALAGVQRTLAAGSGDPQALMGLMAMVADPNSQLAALPVRVRPLLEKQWPWWAEILAHPARDQFWQDLSVADHFEDVTVPALHIGGWFDIFVNSTARTFTELKKRGGNAEVRDGQRLIIGPWDHLNSTGIYPDRQFGLTGRCAVRRPDRRTSAILRPVAARPGRRPGRVRAGPDLRHGHRPVAR